MYTALVLPYLPRWPFFSSPIVLCSCIFTVELQGIELSIFKSISCSFRALICLSSIHTTGNVYVTADLRNAFHAPMPPSHIMPSAYTCWMHVKTRFSLHPFSLEVLKLLVVLFGHVRSIDTFLLGGIFVFVKARCICCVLDFGKDRTLFSSMIELIPVNRLEIRMVFDTGCAIG